jgi:DNA (cytosine-5)-methyltransferase 1
VSSVAAPLEASDGHHGYSSPRGDGADNLIVGDHDEALAPDVAATLFSSGNAKSMPTRQHEDDTNLVTYPGQEPQVAPTLSTKNEVASSSSQRARWYEQSAAMLGKVRRLTPTECERLQGLPDGWTQLGKTPDSKRYAGLGDAVTATVAEWIGRRLIEAMRS